jgi:hypothetical protein
MYGRLSDGGYDARSGKKKQSDIKATVYSFNKLISSWSSDSNEILKLFAALSNVYCTLNAVDHTTSTSAQSSFRSMALVSKFPDVGVKLTQILLVESDLIYKQIKLFWLVLFFESS